MRTNLSSYVALVNGFLVAFMGLTNLHLDARADEAPKLRRPVALQFSQDQRFLYVANEHSGTVSSIDVALRRVAGEVEIGEQIACLESVHDSLLLACDRDGHELLLLRPDGDSISVLQRVPVSPYPVTVAVSSDQKQCVVASLWSRRLTFVALPSGDQDAAHVTGHLDLPFSPRCQLLVNDDESLIVADAFGGRLAIIDVASRKIRHFRDIPGHNIRGLRASADERMLLVAHQMLNELAHTVRNDVHWGLLMSNDLRWLRLEAVLSPEDDIYAGAHMHPLGHAGSATGDPNGLELAKDGTVIVSLGGVGEVAIGREDDFSLQRISVGRRPSSIATSENGKLAVVANTFSDSVSWIDLETREKLEDTSLGEAPELTLAQRGELLFFDARLSHDSWMSCHSCHPDGHTNGLLNDNFSDASFGAPKRVLSLLGHGQTAPFAWNGDAKDLATQVRNSIESTMQSDDLARTEDVDAIAAYVSTLEAPPSLARLQGTLNSDALPRGEELFHRLECSRCHAPPTFTSKGTYDVGLEDQLENRRFNPPSLIGVGQRTKLFHDGRASSLTEVLKRFKHQLSEPLSDSELADLTTYLQSL